MNHHLTGLSTSKRCFRQLSFGFLISIAPLSMLRAENSVQDFKLSGSEELGTSFGQAVALSSKVALVGAPTDNGGTLPEAGAAYLFQKDGTKWDFLAKLADPDGAESDLFGLSVAVSGDVAIVGAPADDDFGEPGDDVLLDLGSAFVFRYNGTTWELEQKLTASDAAGLDLFGFSVAISGNVIIVGADEKQDGPGGSAYVFRYDGTTWNEEAILNGKPGADDNFGISVAISGKVAIVGASPALGDSQSGSAYLFSHADGDWVQTQELLASVPIAGDLFGESVSISGTRAIVSVRGTAVAHIFHSSDGTTWEEEITLVESAPSPGANFGFTVAISGEVALVTAPTKTREGMGNVGSGFLYRLTDEGWIGAEILPDDSPAETGGWSVGLSGDHVLVGTVGENGAAYIYNLAPEIIWETPDPIVAGTLLSNIQLNASAGTIPGTFLYSSPINEELPPGRTTATAFFTPTDIARYAPASAKVVIEVFTPIEAVEDLFVLPLHEDWTDGVTLPDRGFLSLHNDQFTDHSSTVGYSLRLCKVGDPSQLSRTGESMILIALVADSEVRIRIFDGSGAKAFDLPESGLIQGQILDALRDNLSSIEDNFIPTTEEAGFLTAAATYLTGFSPGIYFENEGVRSDTMITAKGATAFTNGVEIIYRNYGTSPGDDSFTYHLSDGGRSDSAMITIRSLIPGEAPGWGDYGRDLSALLTLAGLVADQSSSPDLSMAVELYRSYPDELYAAVVNYPGLGGGLPLGYPVDAPLVDEVPDGSLLQTLQALQPGLIGLLFAETEQVTITVAIAQITRSFMESLVAFSGDADLRSSLSRVLDVDETRIIGLTFAEFATANGLDPERLKLRVLEQCLDFPSYSLTTFHLPNITYSLSRSPSLTSESWEIVTHTETISPEGTITLTDPSTPGGRVFYRIEMAANFGAAGN